MGGHKKCMCWSNNEGKQLEETNGCLKWRVGKMKKYCVASVCLRPFGCHIKAYQYEKTNVAGQFTYFSTRKSLLISNLTHHQKWSLLCSAIFTFVTAMQIFDCHTLSDRSIWTGLNSGSATLSPKNHMDHVHGSHSGRLGHLTGFPVRTLMSSFNYFY